MNKLYNNINYSSIYFQNIKKNITKLSSINIKLNLEINNLKILLNNIKNNFNNIPINIIIENINYNLNNLDNTIKLLELDKSFIKTLKDIEEKNYVSEELINLSYNNNIVLFNPEIEIPKDLFEWNFDVYNINNLEILLNSIGLLFNKTFNLNELDINKKSLALFIKEVSKYYHNNPFHNFYHAVSVLQSVYMLIHNTNAKDVLSKNKLFALFIASLVHDIDHPGNTNLFEINTKSNLALKYNDYSVLENHHCSVAFLLMELPHIKLFNKISNNTFIEIRKTIIDSIIATDMIYHNNIINDIIKKQNNGWNWINNEDQIFLCKIIIHSADLSNPIKSFDISKKVSTKICKEFINQVTIEEKLSLPIIESMRIKDNETFYKNEIFFSEYIVKPLWHEIIYMYPHLKNLTDELDNNINKWKELLVENLGSPTTTPF
jgi:hypothetical protein